MAAHSQISPLIGIPLTLLSASLLAEFFGYWLQRLLHSDKIPFLSRGHLIHHLLIYGPGQPMRLDEYHDATDNRFSVGNVGLEWIAPSAIILPALWGAMRLAHLPALYQSIALVTLIAWPLCMFSYLHDRMHTNFGIGFFLFDRIFRSIAPRHRPFNRAGFEAARLRYGLMEKNGKLIPNADDSSGAQLSARLR